MKPLILFVSAAFLWAAPPPSPSAWGKTSWGMTADQIKRAYPGEAIDLPADGNSLFRVDGGERNAQVGIPMTEIEGTDFRVSFLIGAAGLDNIIISPVDEASQSRDVFAKLQSALVVKYGEPFSNGTAENGIGMTMSQWKTKTSLIQLRFIEISNISTNFVTLSYQRLPAGNKL